MVDTYELEISYSISNVFIICFMFSALEDDAFA